MLRIIFIVTFLLVSNLSHAQDLQDTFSYIKNLMIKENQGAFKIEDVELSGYVLKIHYSFINRHESKFDLRGTNFRIIGSKEPYMMFDSKCYMIESDQHTLQRLKNALEHLATLTSDPFDTSPAAPCVALHDVN